LATELLFALALGLFARSFGYHVNLAELLVVNISVSLLASFIPVPGGIGVAEFGLTVGLTSAGMSAESAIAAVLLYRISTFYLPPVWGFRAMLWLQRNRYLCLCRHLRRPTAPPRDAVSSVARGDDVSAGRSSGARGRPGPAAGRERRGLRCRRDTHPRST